MKAIDILKNMNTLKMEIEILNSEKIMLKEMLNSGNYSNYEVEAERSKNFINDGITFTPVEREFFRQLAGSKLKISDIKNRIKEIESVLNYKKSLLKIIETSLKIINKKEKFLLEMIYIDHMNWSDIVQNYNKKFNKYYISESGLKRNRHEALKKINNIIKNTIIWEINEL